MTAPAAEVPGVSREKERFASPSQNYDTGVGHTTVQQGLGEAGAQASISNISELATNSLYPEATTTTISEETARPDIGAVVREQIRTDSEHSRTGAKRKAEPSSLMLNIKKVKVDVKAGDTIIHNGKLCRVESLGGKRTGRLRNYYNVKEVDSGKQYGIDLGKTTFHKVMGDRRDQQTLVTMVGGSQEVMMQTIPYREHGNLECMEAKRVELEKIVEQFKAVEEVEDVGQFRISCRFVLWYKKHSSGKVEVRSRLVARGYEEVDEVPSDSPTLDQTNLKLIMLIAQAKEMDVVSLDVKSAFLQGMPLEDRVVTVTPPPEAKVPRGKLWRLKVALYGLDDASLRFHFKVRQVMTGLGMKQSRYDPAFFYDLDSKTGEIRGMVGTHVDDFFLGGKTAWVEETTKKIQKKFLLGTIEKGNYLYCGHRIKQQDGRLTIDQEEFAAEVKPIVISPARKRQGREPVTEEERKIIRSAAGKLGWLGRVTRPDLLQAQIEASSLVTKATVTDLKNLAKAVSKVREQKSLQVVPKLSGRVKDWSLKLYTDAAWQNIDDIGSTGGKVLIITDGVKQFPVCWSSNRLKRVCHSSQQAELMALNEGLKDLGYVREMIQEVTGVRLEATVYIDNKNTRQACTSNTAPQDKKVRCELAAAREAVRTGEVKEIKQVSGKTGMLADALTKRKADCSNLLAIIQTGEKERFASPSQNYDTGVGHTTVQQGLGEAGAQASISNISELATNSLYPEGRSPRLVSDK